MNKKKYYKDLIEHNYKINISKYAKPYFYLPLLNNNINIIDGIAKTYNCKTYYFAQNIYFIDNDYYTIANNYLTLITKGITIELNDYNTYKTLELLSHINKVHLIKTFNNNTYTIKKEN